MRKRAAILSAAVLAIGGSFLLFQNAVSTWGSNRIYFVDVAYHPSGFPSYHDFETEFHIVNPMQTGTYVHARFVTDISTEVIEKWIYVNGFQKLTVRLSELVDRRPGFYAVEFSPANWLWGWRATPVFITATSFNRSWVGYNRESSKAVNGVTRTPSRWLFGEGGAYGRTGNGVLLWDNWHAFYNPNDYWISVKIEFLRDYEERNRPPGRTPAAWINVAPRTRIGYLPHNHDPATWGKYDSESGDVEKSSTASDINCYQTNRVTPAPCVAQITMYERYNPEAWSRNPITQSNMGTIDPSTTWYFTNIPTAGTDANPASVGFHTRLYMENPNAVDATVTLYWRNANGQLWAGSPNSGVIRANSRKMYDANFGSHAGDLRPAPQGQGGGTLSLEVRSSAPIAITKILYWNRDSRWTEGAMSIGSSQGARNLYFPGGDASPDRSSYIHLMNTSDQPADVSIAAYGPMGLLYPGGWKSLGTIPGKGVRELFMGGPWMGWDLLSGHRGSYAVQISSTQPLAGEMSHFYEWSSNYHAGRVEMWRAGDVTEAIEIVPDGVLTQFR